MWKIFKALPKSWRQKICSPLGSSQCPDDPSHECSGNDAPSAQDVSNLTCNPVNNADSSNQHEAPYSEVHHVSDKEMGIRCPIARYLHHCWDHGHWFSKWLKQHRNDSREWLQKPCLYEALCVGITLLVERRYELLSHFGTNNHHWRYNTAWLLHTANHTHALNLGRSVLPPSAIGSFVAATKPQTSGVAADLTKASPKQSEDVLLANLEHIAANYMSQVFNAEAKQLAKQKEFVRAIRLFKAAEDLGLAEAKYNLGVCYELGLGVELNLNKAFQYYQEAADLEHGGALYNLAIFHLEGIGVPVNKVRGLEYMAKASDCGIREAITFMGIHYGQQAEFAKAVHLLRKAANLKDANGQYYLGLCYENGFGVEENMVTAMEFFEKASLGGSADATYHLATCFEQGIGGVAEDKIRANELYQKAATAGHELASERLKWKLTEDTDSDDDSYIIFEDSDTDPVTETMKQTQTQRESEPQLAHTDFDNIDAVLSSLRSRVTKLDFSLIKELFKYMKEETASPKMLHLQETDGNCYLKDCEYDATNKDNLSMNDSQCLPAI